jgi:predicted alpha/beta superfamily hydrolase
MKNYLIILITILIVPYNSSEVIAKEDSTNIVIGKSETIFSSVLDESRTLFIVCPENYNNTKNQYPVLYVLDAERYFNYTATLVQFLAQNGRIPQMVIIGIPNTDRSRDFSYKRSEDNKTSGVDRFFRFLKQELIPFVDKNYRTVPYRIIKGWCATGVFCIYGLFTYPELFDAYIASSPYLVKDASFIFQMVEDYPKNGLKSREFIFMSVGGQDRPDAKVEIPKFAALLEKKELNGLEWHFETFDKEDHYTIDLRTFYLGMEVLYSDLIFPQKLAEGNVESARNKIRTLADQYGFEYYLPEDMLTEMGYHLLNQECFMGAITIFKIIVEAYPDSWNAYDSLGEAYMMNGDVELAIQNYRKSLELNTENTNALLMLEKLENE